MPLFPPSERFRLFDHRVIPLHAFNCFHPPMGHRIARDLHLEYIYSSEVNCDTHQGW